MDVLYLVLLIIAALAFAVSAFYTPRLPGDAPVSPMARVNLVSLGLLAWVLVALIQQIDSMS